MMNQIGGRCERDVCQLCLHKLIDFYPIIHWNRSDVSVEIENNPNLEHNPQINEYCFHVVCLVNLVLFNKVINTQLFNNTGNVTIPNVADFYPHGYQYSNNRHYLTNTLTGFVEKWKKIVTLNMDQIDFYPNRALTLDEK